MTMRARVLLHNLNNGVVPSKVNVQFYYMLKTCNGHSLGCLFSSSSHSYNVAKLKLNPNCTIIHSFNENQCCDLAAAFTDMTFGECWGKTLNCFARGDTKQNISIGKP